MVSSGQRAVGRDRSDEGLEWCVEQLVMFCTGCTSPYPPSIYRPLPLDATE